VGQVAVLAGLEMWLVGKQFIKCKDVHTCFPIKMLKLGSFEVGRNAKQPENGWYLITDYNQQMWEFI